METKELARGNERLYYYGSMPECFDCLKRVNFCEASSEFLIFFRAKNKKTITDNVVVVKGTCVNDTPLDEISIGKAVEFIAGDPMNFIGIATGIVKIEKGNFLEIEIIPGELYLYSRINDATNTCSLVS